MNRIILVLLLLISRSASAENICGAVAKHERFHTRIERGSYCMSFFVQFPWGRCSTRACWKGSRSYPPSVRGYACGTRVVCIRQGRGPRYSCRY